MFFFFFDNKQNDTGCDMFKKQLSIFEHSKGILDKCLRDFIREGDKIPSGRGSLGQMVEEIYFGIKNNSNPEADFSDAGVELKTSPLKMGKKNNGEYLVKERLVCNLINYCADVDVAFEESHFFKKCRLMLILYYLYIADVYPIDYKFIYSILWHLPEKDLMIIRRDYDIIMSKVKAGKAHEISEGDTMYLGACRKGAKATDTTKQPYSEIPAPTRAFCLKMAYMRTILDYVKQSGENAVCNYYKPPQEELVSVQALSSSSFDDIILSRFAPYLNQSTQALAIRLSLDLSKNPKNRFAMIAGKIASSGTTTNVNKTEEFEKAGMLLKTVRVQANNSIKESLAFENIDYQEVLDAADWVDSRHYELFTSRFLFVVFKEQTAHKGDYKLEKVFFWTMPQNDLEVAQEYWNNIRENILANHIDPKYFWKIKDHRKFHVRPKATNSDDLTTNPNGGKCKKYCYWFNKDYLMNIVENN